MKQTSFKVMLKEFDAAKKIPLIKEIKAAVPGINLVQVRSPHPHALSQSDLGQPGPGEEVRGGRAQGGGGGRREGRGGEDQSRPRGRRRCLRHRMSLPSF